MDEDNLQEKQKFLSAEILEANFDPQEFQDFMMNNSHKQLNLDDWTMSELKNIVHKFLKFKNAEQQEMEDIRKEGCDKEEFQLDEMELNKAKMEGDMKQYHEDTESLAPSVNTSKYKHFQFVKKVDMPELYVLMYLQKKSFTVSVTKYHKTIPNNIFQSSYILYEIETSQKWGVKRRFTDFVWLHKNLKSAYPGLPIPPIPSKTTMRSFEEKHLKERMRVFERFLNTLTHIPEICSDPILQIFLRADDEYFSHSKKKFEKVAKQNYQTCTVYSIWGDDLVLRDHGVLQTKKIDSFNHIKGIYERINSGILTLKQNLNRCSSCCYTTASYFQKAQTLTNTFTDHQILGVIQQFCQQLGDHLTKTANYVEKSLQQVWVYQSLYMNNLTKYMTQIKREQLEMTERYKNAMKQITQQNVDDMANSSAPTKSIKECQIAKQEYKIKLSNTIREMQRCQKHSLVKITKKWSQNIKTFIGDINQLAIGQVDQLTRAMSIGQGKDLMQVQYIKT